MLLQNILSIICTRGIMLSSLGFEANVLGSNPNSGYLSFFSIFDNSYFSKHKFYNFENLNQISH